MSSNAVSKDWLYRHVRRLSFTRRINEALFQPGDSGVDCEKMIWWEIRLGVGYWLTGFYSRRNQFNLSMCKINRQEIWPLRPNSLLFKRMPASVRVS